MSTSDKPGHDETQLTAPDRLTADLKRLYLHRQTVSEEIDRSVSLMARRHFGASRHVRSVVRWLSVGAAAAAALLVVFWSTSVHHAPPPEVVVSAAIVGDVDASGEVDILDAFALARKLEDAEPLPGEWDLNADGEVNRKDVDAVAYAAVSLRRGHLQ